MRQAPIEPRAPFPIPETGLPGLEALINGDLWHRWAERNAVFPLRAFRAAVRYVRLKPRTSCRIAVFGDAAGVEKDPPPGFLLYLFADVDRARVAFAKAESRPMLLGTAGYEPFLCERSATVAIPFPNDPKIPGLRHVYRPSRLRRTLVAMLPEFGTEHARMIRRTRGTLELLRYKPERRAVYRLETRVRGTKQLLRLHVKLENPATAERSFANLTTIHDALPAGAGWRVPQPRGAFVDQSVLAADWVDGEPLERAGRELPPEVLRHVGRALGGLHEIGASLPPLADAAHEAERLRALGADLAELLPDERDRILELAERLAGQLAALSDERRRVVHGDFHMGQVLQSTDGIVLVDLDRAGSGSPLADLGSFLAHLNESEVEPAAARAFLVGHAEVTGWQPDPDALRLATACATFRRSVFPFRQLDADWPIRVRRRLERATHPRLPAGA